MNGEYSELLGNRQNEGVGVTKAVLNSTSW